ncbi:sugar transporter [Pseudomonas umsongensis]|uniref:Sugar transporter n=1 Tax=Pseudomonas umsongensis TaxID=198618 RepID=A0AAE7DDI8_9PSED|nr:sugar transporter [Pseudomonas umsongensis]QJC78433.1 sugar transporter [Pseudomonas umsongensis]
MNNNSFLSKFFLYVPVKLIPAFMGIFFVFFLYKFFPQGQYVSYSVCVTCALITAQLFAGWVGNSFVYHFSSSEDKRVFFSSSLAVILLIAPIAGLLAASIGMFFVDDDFVFLNVWVLCVSYILFFFLSSVCQADFLVWQQLRAAVLQAVVQGVLVFTLFDGLGVDFRYALVALSVGYISACMLILFSVVRKFGFSNPIIFRDKFRLIVSSLYQYGAALSPWILGMLVMASADRFAIGYYEIEYGDTYLSLKDLFAGGAGLLSMPLLMVVHPLVIRRFKEKRFASSVIESSFAFLIVAFSLLWCALQFVGFDLFERLTGKAIDLSLWVVFFAFVSVFLNSSSVYVQKRLEVHRRMRLLAVLSIVSALVSIVFSYVGGKFWGLYGVSVGLMVAQSFYFFLVIYSTRKKISLYRCMAIPLIVSLLTALIGAVYYYALGEWLGVDDWRIKSMMWLAGFSVIGLLALWKGVRWNEFTRGVL